MIRPDHTVMNHGRARGVLLGQAVGDAFGTTTEFARPRHVAPFVTFLDGPHADLIGRGPFGLAPGQVTDDTQMACCLAASLRENRAYDVADVAARYREWSRHTFDIGGTTSAALHESARRGPTESGRAVWESSGRTLAANGALMRTSPLGVFFASQPEQRRTAGFADTRITHFDPRCQLAGVSFNTAIATALFSRTEDTDRLRIEMIEASRSELSESRDLLLSELPPLEVHILEAHDALCLDLDLAMSHDPFLYGETEGGKIHIHAHQGFVRVAYRLAYWYLMRARSFREALVDCANRGGDADTNCAITGALLGALFSDRGIPDHWIEVTLGALQDEPPGPLRDAYHPKQLLAMLEEMP